MSTRSAGYVAFAFLFGWFGGYEMAKLANGLPPSGAATLILGGAAILGGLLATRLLPDERPRPGPRRGR